MTASDQDNSSPTSSLWEPTIYPLAIRDRSPGAGYIRLEIEQQPGQRLKGMHTGGPWYHPDVPNSIWKPLDARPFANADCHVQTREDEVLALMKDQPGFPCNWQVSEQNGRRWLVRERAYTCPPYEPKDLFKLEHVLTIERGLRALNAAGWQLGDWLNVGLDYNSYEPFILDLSNAHPQSVAHFCNDEDRWIRWAEYLGYNSLVQLRKAARNLVQGRESLGRWPAGYRYVYASYNRPLSLTWMSTPECDAELVQNMPTRDTRVHTWLITTQPLDDDYLRRYELTFAWAPWGPLQKLAE